MTVKPRAKRRAVRPAQIAKAVDEGRESLDLYLDEISRVPLLTRDEEMELARKAFRGNVLAQEKLARHNVRFVVSVAKKFQNRGVPLVDLIGEGNLGLMTAARKERLGRMPTTEELARATGLTPEAVRSLSALNTEAVRLDHPTRDGDGNERMERFAMAVQEGTDSATMTNSQTSDIESALAVLPPRDAKVLRLYFGLDDGNSRTLEEIGRMMGVTRERIRQLRDRALLKLREGETGERLRDLVA